MSAVPAPPWQGRSPEPELTPEGYEIVRGPFGAHYQPPGTAHWLPYEPAEELARKLYRRPRRAVQGVAWSVWDH